MDSPWNGQFQRLELGLCSSPYLGLTAMPSYLDNGILVPLPQFPSLQLGWAGLALSHPGLNTFLRPIDNHCSPPMNSQVISGTGIQPRAIGHLALALLLEYLGMSPTQKGRARVQNCCTNTSATLLWPKRITEQPGVKGWENRLHLEMGEQPFIYEAVKTWGCFFSVYCTDFGSQAVLSE